MTKFKAGETIVKQDSLGKEFYILIKGSVAVIKDTIRLAEYTEPGTVIGEISAILGTPRTATIVCEEDSDFIVISGLGEKEIIENPDIIMYTLINMAERLAAITDGYTTVVNKQRFFALQKWGLV